MNNIGDLVKTTLEEMEKVMTTKTVVGDPVTIEGRTIVPLISIGFGFGAGGGSGKGESRQRGEGEGGGTGGGAWVRPIAVIILDRDTIRVEPIMGSWASAIDKMGERIPTALENIIDKWWQNKRAKEES